MLAGGQLMDRARASTNDDVLAVGMRAPDFVLRSSSRSARRLSDLRGHPVILAFFPDGWDPARGDELAMYNRLVSSVPGAGAELLGISMDGGWCDLILADGRERVPCLGTLDVDGDTASRFGVCGMHALFVLDASGVVRWRHAAPPGARPVVSEVRDALIALVPRADDTPARPSNAPSRREFIATALGAAFTLALLPSVSRAQSLTSAAPLAGVVAGASSAAMDIVLRINGRDVPLSIEPQVSLLDALRERAHLTGTKKGCDHGQCGACTVHVDGRRILSCLTLAVMQQGKEITTVEGLARGEQLHPMQQAFIDRDGFQCGYCTPGQLMSAVALLKEPCGPSDADVRECMSGNICRCGAYSNIVAAVQDVRRGSGASASDAPRGGI